MEYINVRSLIGVDELAERLGDERLRIFDTAVMFKKVDQGLVANSSIETYREAHIPGAAFADVLGDWSNPETPYRNVLSIDALQRKLGGIGLNEKSEVVVYSSTMLMWATRAWWCLRYAGAENVRILNGSFGAWQKAGLEVESGDNHYPPDSFTSRGNASLFCNTEQVERISQEKGCLINALAKDVYEGTSTSSYGRPGHIPASHSQPFSELLESDFFLDPEFLQQKLTEQNMLGDEDVTIYCGGGIAATINAFACHLMGKDNVSVYDGSLTEWNSSANRPIKLGSDP